MIRERAQGVPGRIALANCVLLLAVCGKTGETEKSRPDSMPSPAMTSARAAPPRGVRFDPRTIRPGMQVGQLVVDSVTADRALADSTYVGVARFRGQIELTGWTMRHPDAELPDAPICFEADSASAARLPRWSGDERRPWFCFANRGDAVRALGPPSDRVPATIVVEQFTIHRGLSDQVNTAQLVRLVRGGAAASRPASPN